MMRLIARRKKFVLSLAKSAKWRTELVLQPSLSKQEEVAEDAETVIDSKEALEQQLLSRRS